MHRCAPRVKAVDKTGNTKKRDRRLYKINYLCIGYVQTTNLGTNCFGQNCDVENANKLLRQYFPKVTDFRIVEKTNWTEFKQKSIEGRAKN